VALALVIFAVRASRRAKPRLAPSTVTLINDQAVSLDQLQSASAQGELPDGQPTESGLIMLASSPEDVLAAAKQQQLTEVEQQHRTEIKENLISIAQNHPEMLANVIQSWFDE
jgi:flagellar biosynthesis/type III secretory pathway M-ring protein FliF/YscJ